ncbi:MAG: endonuclease III [Bacteroidaceae bacterium]|nr:endonuclease III [Bacteroidaceae bacterium]MBR1520228.1 endonuclease III [Bacteroidaceae bacterium]
MTKKERYTRFIEYFQVAMPEANTELEYKDPFQLLCAVMLSAQCTDKRVNMVTPALFQAFPTPQTMAAATKDDVFVYVKSVSYPNSKAEHLVQMARMLMEKHNGEVPGDFDALVELPGVGRKTANVMLSVAFNQTAMAVDTHVFRVSHRIGLVSDKCTTPYAVEKELVKNIPAELIPRAHHWLILHGRYVCKSLKPQCKGCGLKDFCKTYSSNKT